MKDILDEVLLVSNGNKTTNGEALSWKTTKYGWAPHIMTYEDFVSLQKRKRNEEDKHHVSSPYLIQIHDVDLLHFFSFSAMKQDL